MTYKPVVYVVQDVPGRNLTKALEFGSLLPVLDADDELRIMNVAFITHKIKSRLAKITPHDFLILIGNPVSIGIACAIVADVTGGRFNVLKWDNQSQMYFPLSVDLNRVES